MLADGRDIDDYLPVNVLTVFRAAWQAGRHLDMTRLFTALLGRLLQEPACLQGTYQVEHGLDTRLAEAARVAKDYASLGAAVKSRHWTLTRIQRILAYVLLQVSRAEMEAFLGVGPLYLRATRIYTGLMKAQTVQNRNRDFFEPVRRSREASGA
jgi:predicted nucleotidyltransferase